MSRWNQDEWAEDAKRVLDWRMMSSTHPLMLVLKHSHREERTTVEEILKLRLTPIGKQVAYLFGKSLPEKKRVEVYYSSHPRCVETAEEIAKGYNSVHGGAALMSDIRVLLGPQGSGKRIGNEMLAAGGPEFIRCWIRNDLSEDTIEPIDVFGTVFKQETLGRLEDAHSNSMHIHVTHDLVLMGARYVLFGTIPTSDNWTPFLGGFGVCRQDDRFIGFEMGREVELH